MIYYRGTLYKTKYLDRWKKRIPNLPVDFLEDRKSFPFDTTFHTLNSLAPSFLALPPLRAPPADNLIGDDDDKHDNGAVAEEGKLDNDDGFLVMLPEEAYLPEDATVVRCFSWD